MFNDGTETQSSQPVVNGAAEQMTLQVLHVTIQFPTQILQPEAISALYDCYKDYVFKTAVHITGDHFTAESLVNDTFLKIFTRIGLYNPESSSLKTWIGTIARNLAIDTVKRGKAFQQIPLEDASRHTGGGDPYFEVEHAELVELIAHHVLDLPHVFQNLIRQYYFDDTSQAEIATIMGMTTSAVKNQMVRARQSLKASIIADEKLSNYIP